LDEITPEDYYAAAALTGTLAAQTAQTRKVPIDVVGKYAMEIGLRCAHVAPADGPQARASRCALVVGHDPPAAPHLEAPNKHWGSSCKALKS